MKHLSSDVQANCQYQKTRKNGNQKWFDLFKSKVKTHKPQIAQNIGNRKDDFDPKIGVIRGEMKFFFKNGKQKRTRSREIKIVNNWPCPNKNFL